MTRKAPEIIEVNAQQFEELLERAASNTLRDEDTQLLRQLFESYAGLFQIVGDKDQSRNNFPISVALFDPKPQAMVF